MEIFATRHGAHLFVQGLRPNKIMESMHLSAHWPLHVYKNRINMEIFATRHGA